MLRNDRLSSRYADAANTPGSYDQAMLFSRSPKPEASAQPVTPPNAPAGLYDDATNRYAEIYGGALVESRRWFLIALASLVLAIAAVMSAALLFPLKEVRPWVVEINPATGVVNRPVEVQQVDPAIAVVKAELARWVEAVYLIDPLRTPELMRWANGRTADKAIAQFQEFRARERVFERTATEKELIREAKVTAVDGAQRGTAFIFVTTTERVGAAPPPGDAVRRWRVTVNYKFVQAKQESDLLANPLGLVITHFSDVQERAN